MGQVRTIQTAVGISGTPAIVPRISGRLRNPQKYKFVLIQRMGKCRIVSRNGRFYLRWYQPRKSHRASAAPAVGRTQTGQQPSLGSFSTLEEAQAKAREIDAALRQGLLQSPIGSVSVGDAVDTVLKQISQDVSCSPATSRNYQSRWRYLREFSDIQKLGYPLVKIDHVFVAAFESWLLAQQVSPNGHSNAAKRSLSDSHKKNILEAAGTLWEKSKHLGLIVTSAPNPFRSRSRGRRSNVIQFPGFEHRRIDRVFLQEFLDACDPWQLRVFLLMLGLGLRTDEVRHVLCERIDLAKGFFVLDPMVNELGWNTKNGKWRLIPILPEFQALFAALLQTPDRKGVLVLEKPLILETRSELFPRPSMATMIETYRTAFHQHCQHRGKAPTPAEQEALSETVFLRAGALHKKRIYLEFRQVLKKLGTDKVLWPHLTRGYAVSRAHQAGVDRFVAQAVIGHADGATFDRYCEHDAAFMRQEWGKVLHDNAPVLDGLRRVTTTPM